MTDNMIALMKRCPRCKETKVRAEFGNSRQKRDGVAPYCRACTNAYSSARRTLKPVVERSCRNCATAFLPAHFNIQFCSDTCRTAFQNAEKKEYAARHYEENWAHRRALSVAWKKANPDKCRVHRKKAYQVHKAAERAAHDAWVARNREYWNARTRDWRHQQEAIDVGKSAFRRTGFALVREQSKPGDAASIDWEWRVVALNAEGCPRRLLTAREQLVAVYQRRSGHWDIDALPTANPDVRNVVERLKKRETRAYRRAV